MKTLRMFYEDTSEGISEEIEAQSIFDRFDGRKIGADEDEQLTSHHPRW